MGVILVEGCGGLFQRGGLLLGALLQVLALWLISREPLSIKLVDSATEITHSPR
ncbi:hypothetical protein [Pseudorhizobium endolithicum]|uniref:hypothetical protein n=1 Tax=Pseudorhizobium endolithicum TaxID=1191678 RepID=UPI00163BB40C|nr:hypothetical protein [Pseudorhizobium endolithicum]